MSVFEFHLDAQSGVSFYVQLIHQVREALLFGILKPGDRLPTVKEVAAHVAINPNTVLRAYRDLEHDGIVVSRPGLGTFIDSGAPSAIASDSYRTLRSDLERCIRKARAQGLDDATITSLFAHVLRENTKEGAA